MAEITILKSLGIPLCKRFEKEAKHPYPTKVKQFFADVRQVTNIHELSKLLCQLEQNEPTACVIRGGLADGVDTNRPILRRLRRSNEEDFNDAPLVDVPQPWIMLDIDKLALPEGIDLVSNTEQAISFVLQQLPA